MYSYYYDFGPDQHKPSHKNGGWPANCPNRYVVVEQGLVSSVLRYYALSVVGTSKEHNPFWVKKQNIVTRRPPFLTEEEQKEFTLQVLKTVVWKP